MFAEVHRIHLPPLLFGFESFPVTLKMYFLLSDPAPLYMDTMPDKASLVYPVSVLADNGSSSCCFFFCSDALSGKAHSSDC